MKISITKKLLGGFAIAVVPAGIIAGIAVTQLSAASDRGDQLYREGVVATRLINETKYGFDVGLARAGQLAYTLDQPEVYDALIVQIQGELAAGVTSFEELGTYLSSPEAQAVYAPAAETVAQFNELTTQYAEAAAVGDFATVAAVGEELQPVMENLTIQIADLQTYVNEASLNQAEGGSGAAASARTLVLILGGVAILLAAAVGFWLSRGISKGIGQAVAAAKRIAHGETDVELSFTSNDEVGDLADSFRGMTAYLSEMATAAVAVSNGDLSASVTPRSEKDGLGIALSGMVSNLREMIGNVRQSAAAITDAAESLRGSSDQMATATGQIANAIDEVTRSAVSLSTLSQDSAREVERLASGSQQLAATASTSASSASQSKLEAAQIGERIQLVASASQEVARAAEDSRSAAQQGQDAVAQAVSSMESIAQAVLRASSTVDQLGEYGQQIGDIVKAIDEIAAQTNLLALNAAIEAARAGEQGRGFAVVAENVRSLAERSSESTKEIAALIAKVQAGTQEAVDAMAAGVKDVEQGREITSEAGKALESIISSVQQSAVQMQTIASDVQGLAGGADRIVASAEQIATMASESASGAAEMASGTSRVTDAIVQVSATSEQTSASAQDVSASTEELSAQSEELAATASQMKDLAEGLTAATARFKLA